MFYLQISTNPPPPQYYCFDDNFTHLLNVFQIFVVVLKITLLILTNFPPGTAGVLEHFSEHWKSLTMPFNYAFSNHIMGVI